MSNQFDNYLKIILYQSRLCASSLKIDSYSLTFSLCSTSFETEAISLPEMTFKDKCFYFQVPRLPLARSIEITAKSKSMYLTKKTISHIAIPYSIAKCTHQRQWFFLKSDDNENILKVLIAFHNEITPIMKLTSQAYYSDLSYDAVFPSSSPRYFNINDKERERDRDKGRSIDRGRGRGVFLEREKEPESNRMSISSITSKCTSHKLNLTLSRSNSIELLDTNFKSKLAMLGELRDEWEDEKGRTIEKRSKLFLTMIKSKLNSINAFQEEIDKNIEHIKQKEQELKEAKLILAKDKHAFESSMKELNISKSRYNRSSLELISNYTRYDKDRDIQAILTEIDDWDKKAFIDNSLVLNSSLFLMPKDKVDINGCLKNKIINLHSTAKKSKTSKKLMKGKQQPKHMIRADSSSQMKNSKVKLLNSTNFTSNCSEMPSNTNLIESVLSNQCSTSNSSKLLTSKMSMGANVSASAKKPKALDRRLIDSIDSPSHKTQKSFYKKAKKPLKIIDNIKVIKIKARKCTPTKNKSKHHIDLRSTNNSINNHTQKHNITSRKHTSSIKSTEKSQTLSSLKESSSVQNLRLLKRAHVGKGDE